MNILTNILLTVALIGGAVALFVYFDKVEAKLFGTVENGSIEDSETNTHDIKDILGSKYAVYISSIAVGAIMEIGNAFGGSFILGFHGFWCCLCTFLPLLIFASFSVYVFEVLEDENNAARIAARLLFMGAASLLGFFAGAFVMGVVLLVICLIVGLWFGFKLLSFSLSSAGSSSSSSSVGSYGLCSSSDSNDEGYSSTQGYDVVIKNGGISGSDIRANRNCDGSLTDEYFGHWEGDGYGNYHKC